MPDSIREVLRFKRNHFSARFPVRYLYSPSHFWLFESRPGSWRVGLTNFATRMLGEIVEVDFEVAEGSSIDVGQVVGWVEGFKAISDIHSVVEGEFGPPNPAAVEGCEIISRDPYGEGWLYSVNGTPDPRATDASGYASHLTRTIDEMLEKPWRSPEIHEP